MLDRNITSKLRVFDPSISTFIRLYHTKTKLPRTIQPSRCVPAFLLVLSYQIKQNPQTWKVWGRSKTVPNEQSSCFVRKPPYSGGSLTQEDFVFGLWFLTTRLLSQLIRLGFRPWPNLPHLKTVFTVNESQPNCKEKFLIKQPDDWGGMFRWKRLFCLLSASKKINIC